MSSIQSHSFAENAKYYAKEALGLTVNTAIRSGAHALVAGALFTINPIAGAIVGGTSYLTSKVINTICEKCNIAQGSALGKTAQWILSTAGGIAVGALAAKAAGFAITFSAAAWLSLTTSALFTAATIISVIAGVAIFGTIAIALLGILAAAGVAAPHLAENFAGHSLNREAQAQST